MSKLDDIIERGNRHYRPTIVHSDSRITCADEFHMSVIAGFGTYCSPRGDDEYRGPYTHVEVGYPSERPEPWDLWRPFAESPKDPTGTVYAQVPVDMVRALVELHGGEA